jgi:hypothetical protein
MKDTISQLMQMDGAMSVNPFADQLADSIQAFDVVRANSGWPNIAGSEDRLDAFYAQLTAWNGYLTDIATPKRLVEIKSVMRAKAEFAGEADECSDTMVFFDDLFEIGERLTVSISEAITNLAASLGHSLPVVEAALQVIDQLTEDLSARVDWLSEKLAEIEEFENRLAEALAVVTAAADPCLKTVLERTVPPDVAVILNIS